MRVVMILAGLLLVVLPGWMLVDMTVPVPRFRVGTFADYRPLVLSWLTLYGGAAAGLLAVGMRRGWRPPGMDAGTVFGASAVGSVIAVCVAIALAGAGNLWGLVTIFGGVFGAVIAAGAALLWRAVWRLPGS